MNENKDHSVKNALEAVAKQEGISVETMRREIDIVIAAARQSDDPVVQNLWKLVSEKGGASLTPEGRHCLFCGNLFGRNGRKSLGDGTALLKGPSTWIQCRARTGKYALFENKWAVAPLRQVPIC